MNESIGYTATLNIAIIFVTIIFAFISFLMVYYKGSKVNKYIVDSIEKYEGYNAWAQYEIEEKMASLGYSSSGTSCSNSKRNNSAKKGVCSLVSSSKDSLNGFCVYYCDTDDDYYFYMIYNYMGFDIPIIRNLVNYPIKSRTSKIYKFDNGLSDED